MKVFTDLYEKLMSRFMETIEAGGAYLTQIVQVSTGLSEIQAQCLVLFLADLILGVPIVILVIRSRGKIAKVTQAWVKRVRLLVLKTRLRWEMRKEGKR